MNADRAAPAINTPHVTTQLGRTIVPVTKDSLVMAINVQVIMVIESWFLIL